MPEFKFQEKAEDRRMYRNALGRFATGVALVAARDDKGTARAITINSFCSISLDPPIVSWAIDEASDRYHIFAGARDFSINVLRAEQQPLADRFTRRTEARLEDGTYDIEGQTPLLRDVLMRLSCRVRFMEAVGDHTIIFGDVVGFEDFGPGDALGYVNGGYVVIAEGEN